MSATNYLELKLLDLVFGQSAYTGSATLYFGLSTTDPTDTGTLTGEPTSTGGYTRVAVTNNLTNFPSANPKLNGGLITFPVSTVAWSTNTTALGYWFVTDAAALGTGNMLMSGAVTTPRTVDAAGIILEFAASSISITAD
jgi:hypothetical protein